MIRRMAHSFAAILARLRRLLWRLRAELAAARIMFPFMRAPAH